MIHDTFRRPHTSGSWRILVHYGELSGGLPSDAKCCQIASGTNSIAVPSPSSMLFRIALRFKQFRVIHVMAAQSAAPRRTIMTTFTIDQENTITAFGSTKEAAAVGTTPFDSFSNPRQLAELLNGWPAERLVAIWNSLPALSP
jgi:hypothetical protein